MEPFFIIYSPQQKQAAINEVNDGAFAFSAAYRQRR
jgi:hypothetical protein